MPSLDQPAFDKKTDAPPAKNEKEAKLNVFLDELVMAGMRVTSEWNTIWVTALRYAWGDQLRDLKKPHPKEDWSYIVINRIYPLMFQNIAKLAKNNPKVLTFAWDEEKEGVSEFVEQWAGVLQYIWESPYQLQMRLKLILGLLDAAVFGYMVGKTFWDDRVRYEDDQKKFIGDVQHAFVHPASFWCDPSAETLEDAENCGTQRTVRMEWAQKRWPKFKDDIKANAFNSEDPRFVAGNLVLYENQPGDTVDTRGNKGMPYNMTADLVLNSFSREARNSRAGGNKSQEYVRIQEIYWKDDETKKVKIEDDIPAEILEAEGLIVKEDVTGFFIDTKTNEPIPEGEWPKQVVNEYDEPKFPNGRFILRIGNLILNPDEINQRYKYSRWPFTVMPYNILPHMWQGGNAIEMVRNNNDILNLTMSALVHRTRLAAEPERIMEEGAIAKNRKGLLRRLNPFGLGKYITMAKGRFDKLRNLEYGPIDPAMIALAGILKQDISDNEFMQDIARGAQTGGKTTATEAVRLNQNSLDMTAMQAIFLDQFIGNTLVLIAEIVQDRYEPERLLRIIDTDRETTVQRTTRSFLDVRFDVNIEPGSTLPFDEEARKADYGIAYKMLESPIPNPLIEDMLRILKITNRKKVLARYQGLNLFKQFVAMSQQLALVSPEDVQKVLDATPELAPLLQLLVQASQLAGPTAQAG